MKKSTLRKALWAAALGMAGFLGACGDSSTGPGGSNNGGGTHNGLLDACLLTDAEAQALMGAPVTKRIVDTTSYSTSCSYRTGTFGSPHITITGWTTWALKNKAGVNVTAQQHFENLKTSAIDSGMGVAETGVGDDAFWFTGYGQLWFYKGDVEASVIYSPDGTIIDSVSATRAKAKEIAISVVAHL